MLAGRRDVALRIVDLLGGLALKLGDVLHLDAGRDVEVRPQAGVLLQPELVVGFQPVDLAVFVGVEGDGAEQLAVIGQGVHAVILVQVRFQFGGEALVGRVADAQHRDAPAAEPFAEVPVGLREIGGDEYKVHSSLSISILSGCKGTKKTAMVVIGTDVGLGRTLPASGNDF